MAEVKEKSLTGPYTDEKGQKWIKLKIEVMMKYGGPRTCHVTHIPCGMTFSAFVKENWTWIYQEFKALTEEDEMTQEEKWAAAAKCVLVPEKVNAMIWNYKLHDNYRFFHDETIGIYHPDFPLKEEEEDEETPAAAVPTPMGAGATPDPTIAAVVTTPTSVPIAVTPPRESRGADFATAGQFVYHRTA